MNKKIEVGEWVRTNDGDIFKFGGYCKDGIIDSMVDEKGILYGNQKRCCKAHSKNKEDLIEAGDIVELTDSSIEEVIYIWNEEMLEAIKQDIKEGLALNSILTHEQFEEIKYNFEEE